MKHAKDNNIRTGLFSRNKIVKNDDKSYSIDNKQEHTSTSDYGGDIGVQTGSLVTGKSENSQSVSGQIMSGTLMAAAVTSQLDSPVPGPADLLAAGELVLGGAAAAVAYLTIDRMIVHSKGGKQNIWPDEYDFPDLQNIDWGKSDSQLANEVSQKAGDSNKGPKSANNKAKKWFRDKRPKTRK